MSRKKRRRRRRPEAEAVPTPSEPRDLTEAERSRLLQRFACMKGRGVVVGYVPFGPVVQASTPSELAEKAEALLVEETLAQRPS